MPHEIFEKASDGEYVRVTSSTGRPMYRLDKSLIDCYWTFYLNAIVDIWKLFGVETALAISPAGNFVLDGILDVISKEWSSIQFEKKDFNKQLTIPEELETLPRVYISWNEEDPYPYWIRQGWIRPEDYIFNQTKTKEKKAFYKENVKYVDIWVNCEGNVFFKFPECNKYHRLAEVESINPREHIDENNLFMRSPCKCGINKYKAYLIQDLVTKEIM